MKHKKKPTPETDAQKTEGLRRRIIDCVSALREEQILTDVVHRKQKIAKLLEGCPTEDAAWRPNDPTWMMDFDEAVVEWFTHGLFI